MRETESQVHWISPDEEEAPEHRRQKDDRKDWRQEQRGGEEREAEADDDAHDEDDGHGWSEGEQRSLLGGAEAANGHRPHRGSRDQPEQQQQNRKVHSSPLSSTAAAAAAASLSALLRLTICSPSCCLQWLTPALLLLWLCCMLLGLNALRFINLDLASRYRSARLWLQDAAQGSAADWSSSSSSSAPAAAAEVLPMQCSQEHIKPIAAHLYATTPLLSIPFASLPSLASSSISPSSFLTASTYNPIFPSQVYHNVCLLARSSNAILLLTGRDGLNASEKAQRWLQQKERQLQRSGERAQTLWQHFWYQFVYGDEANSSWRYLAGTTVVERKLDIYHGRSWNFGHMMADFILPYTMQLSSTAPHPLTRNPQPIDTILVQNGCIAPLSPYSPLPPTVDPDLPPLFDRGSNSTLPQYYPRATADTVWPVMTAAAPPFQWMLRMLLRSLDGTGRKAGGKVQDATWNGLRLLHLFNRSASPSMCVDRDQFEETLCFERLLILGRQEDRDNRKAGEEENRRAFFVIRNITMQTMQVAEPVHVPFNVSDRINETEGRQLQAAVMAAAARESTLTGQLYTASLAASNVSSPSSRPLPRVLLYGRQDATRRIWDNVGETARVLSRVPSLSLTYLQSMHDLSVCEQMVLFSRHDVFIMPHGAALFSLLWSPPLSLVLEVFPNAGVDWTWLFMFISALQLHWRRVDGDERVQRPELAGGLREGGQDDVFRVSPARVLQTLQEAGMDMTEGWRLLAQEHPANSSGKDGSGTTKAAGVG